MILNGCNGVEGIEPYDGYVLLNKSSITLKEVGETFQLVATTDPVSLANKGLTWTSSDTSIATVSSTGLVSCVSPGECVITVMTNTKRYTATCNVSEGRTPGSNTVLYLPMSDDLLDHSGNNISITANNVSLRETDRLINVGYFGGGDNACLSFTNTSNMSGSWTICTWFKTASNANQWFLTQGTESSNKGLHLGYGETSRGMLMGFYSNDMDSNSTNGTDNDRHLATFTYNGGGESKIYLDGELIKSGALSGLNTGNNTGYIGRYLSGTNKFNGYMSERIMENVVWTASDIKDYYNITKGTYKGTIEDFDILEYIQSSGSQVIKTGVYITETGIRADIDFQITSSASSDQAMIGFYNNENGSNSYRCGYGANDGFTLSSGVSSLDRQTGTGNSISFTASSYQIYLFAKQRYTNGNYDSNATGKLYSCQIYKGNTLVRDFIPVKRKSDGVIGVWDNVNGDFYTNQGSGTFTAGPKIGITLSSNSVSLETAGATHQLTVSANPASIAQGGYVWSSSDISIATVSQNGLITCITPGDCIITCKANTGGYTDTCSVGTVQEYVMLSEGGSVNRFSEFSLASNNTNWSVRDNTTNRIGQATQTDKNSSIYKVFDKEIVGFDISRQLTETYAHEGIGFQLQTDTGTRQLETQRISFDNKNETYDGTYGQQIYKDSTRVLLTGSTTRDTVNCKGTKSGNTWTFVYSGGYSGTHTVETSDKYYNFAVSSRRRYTSSNIGNFSKVVLYLK